MIINKEDITTFRGAKIEGDLALKRIANIHNPSGVFFICTIPVVGFG